MLKLVDVPCTAFSIRVKGCTRVTVTRVLVSDTQVFSQPVTGAMAVAFPSPYEFWNCYFWYRHVALGAKSGVSHLFLER